MAGGAGLNFTGSLPTLIATFARLCKPQDWRSVYVACSGTFRTERVLLKLFPDMTIHSNDVSLYTCALAGLATGKPLPFTFKGDLAFIEDLELETDLERVAAVLVARNLGAYATGKPNRYKAGRVAHYKRNFREMIAETAGRIETFPSECRIASFQPRDWLAHVDEAIEVGAGVIAYPPTIAGGYEKMYAYLGANVEWQEPAYKVFDPKSLPDVVRKVDASGAPYFIYADQEIDGLEPIVRFESKGHKDVFGYGRSDKSGWRRPKNAGEPFLYRPLDVTKIGKGSKLTVVRSTAPRLNFLKNSYLKKTIMHGQGEDQFLVYLDDMLAGGLVYRRPMGGDMNALEVLADFSTSRDGRVAKLIARVAVNNQIVRDLNRKYVRRFTRFRTMAFSDHPVAMKYRGTWELVRRVENDRQGAKYVLSYECDVRSETLDETFRWWWLKDGKAQVGKAQNGNPPG